MGGSAFTSQLGTHAFPRLPPRVYQALKARCLSKISELYSLTAVPIEAPEKTSYGDLDILVAEPIQGTRTAEATSGPFLAHSLIQSLLGATHVVQGADNRTSNYAVPVALGEWAPLGHQAEEGEARHASEDGNIFYQVDVHPCYDKSEFERIKFFNSYGDMGMILGLTARHIGLRLGVHGLKIPNPPLPPFELSDNFQDILGFLGLSWEAYKAGFTSKAELFKWVGSMKWLDPHHFKTGSASETKKKVKDDRKIYHEFVRWLADKHLEEEGSHAADQQKRAHTAKTELYRAAVREEALKHFKKTDEYYSLHSARERQQRARVIFSGHQVRDWADLGEYWKGVKMIMDEIRNRLGGEDGVLAFYDDRGEEALVALVRDTRDELGIVAFGHGRMEEGSETPTDHLANSSLRSRT